MLDLLQQLLRHKGYANAALLRKIYQHEPAAQDPELRKLMHHVLLANRFWLSLCLGRPFLEDKESEVPESIEALSARYGETHSEELEWLSRLQEADLNRVLETDRLPGYQLSVSQIAMQVCLHSHGHRAQCATRLRLLGGTPPVMDFVDWLKARSAPEWL